jgi:hypothetical protein
MACSVYCAAFLLEAAYDGNDGDLGQALLTGTGTNSWMHEIGLGAGAAMEAWDPAEKSNLTYSHPWGASPAYNIPQDLFGIKPTTPAYATFQVKPQRGSIQWANITVPTPNGSIGVAFDADGDSTDEGVMVPANSIATVYLPATSSDQTSVYVDGVETAATYDNGFMRVDAIAPGCHVLTNSSAGTAYGDTKLTDVCAGGYQVGGESPVSPITNLTLPVIQHPATVRAGATLTATPGTWKNADGASYAYQWLRDGVAIPGATSSRYAVTTADAGMSVSVAVTAAKAGAAAVTVTSSAVPVHKLSAQVRAKVKAHRGKRAKLKVRVLSAAPVSGTVRVVVDGKKVKAAVVLVGGKATVKLPKLHAGRHTVKVRYSGSTTVGAAHTKVVVRVR